MSVAVFPVSLHGPTLILPSAESLIARENLGQHRNALRARVPTPIRVMGPAFELVCDHELPEFDTSKSLKSTILSPKSLDIFNRIRFRWRNVFALMMQLGNILMVISVLAPRWIGRNTAVIAPLLQLPGTIIIVAAFRIQMMRILLGTYDFWFFTLSNVVFCACFGILLGDVRVVSMAFGCLIVQISICADAQVGNARQLLIASFTNTMAHTILFFAVLLHIVDVESESESEVTLLRFASGSCAVSSRDMLVNTQFNLIVLFGKLTYRNFRIVREKQREGRLLSTRTMLVPQRRKCVSYQCILRLAPTILTTAADARAIRRPRGNSTSMSQPLSDSDIARLQYVPIREAFSVRDTVFPVNPGGWMESLLFPQHESEGGRIRSAYIFKMWLYYNGVLGFVGASLSDVMNVLPLGAAKLHFRIMTMTCSIAYCATFIAFYQRRLLNRLIWSFDFLFLSSKLTMICYCACVIFDWDERVMPLVGFWVWMHWILTLDALTPTAAAALGFRRVYMLPLILLMVGWQVFVTLDMALWHHFPIPDENLLGITIAGRRVVARIAPFFFARVLAVFLWSSRLLWRVFTLSSDDERLLLHGQVEFRFQWRKRLRTGTLARQIAPTT